MWEAMQYTLAMRGKKQQQQQQQKKKNSSVQLFALYKSQRGFKYTGCKQQMETHISEGAVLFRLDCTLLSRLQDITSATWVQDIGRS